MPNLDGTLPLWQGSKTGRVQGNCWKMGNWQWRRMWNWQGSWQWNRMWNWQGMWKKFSVNNNCMSLDDKEKMLEERLKKVRAVKQQLN